MGTSRKQSKSTGRFAHNAAPSICRQFDIARPPPRLTDMDRWLVNCKSPASSGRARREVSACRFWRRRAVAMVALSASGLFATVHKIREHREPVSPLLFPLPHCSPD